MRFPFQDTGPWNDMYQELQREGCRAAAVLGASFLDALLADLLTAFLVDDPDEVDELMKPERPLGSFGARMRMAYCLGLLSDDENHDLRLINKIRNIFAHQLHGITFHTPEIKDRCANLLTGKSVIEFAELAYSPRVTFDLTISTLSMQLGVRAIVARGQRRVRQPNAQIITHSVPNSTSEQSETSDSSG